MKYWQNPAKCQLHSSSFHPTSLHGNEIPTKWLGNEIPTNHPLELYTIYNPAVRTLMENSNIFFSFNPSLSAIPTF